MIDGDEAFVRGLHPDQLARVKPTDIGALLPYLEMLASDVGALVMTFRRAEQSLQVGGYLGQVLDAQMADVMAAYGRLLAAHDLQVRQQLAPTNLN
jgi:hypothetical protein